MSVKKICGDHEEFDGSSETGCKSIDCSEGTCPNTTYCLFNNLCSD